MRLRGGNIEKPGAFQHLFCQREQQLTPHFVVRILREQSGEIELALRCGRCGNRMTFVTDQLPEGMRLYDVRVVGEAGQNPLTGQPLEGFEDCFTTVGISRQDAYQRAQFGLQTLPNGHLVKTFIDGVEHQDERC